MALQIGDKVPDLLGNDQNGQAFQLSEQKEKKWIIYFYPKDNTSGCTAEACSFRDDYQQLKQMGYGVIGISADSEKSHQKFINSKQLPFQLIADSEHQMAEYFGVWKEKKMMGRTYMGIVRTTFITNEEGIITHILSQKQIQTSTHAQQLIQLLA
ncbi:MAG: thioredoxin-dependent thiol peroxidase [Paludibacteraceae bacterium]|nr:thioredoxin-dependent thiol peroxidase [Paludibacteraceae bacterium]MBO7233418.1 thioredoxin-dependent thiol peroxidase [Paludibacteraceae bacterium]MBO7258806.1 thioredoxin-dependent thiol peroxidase [Paludibacteraceae bacterium]